MSDKKSTPEDKKINPAQPNPTASVLAKKSSIVGIILFVVILVSFVLAPMVGVMLGGGINQLKFGSYGNRDVSYVQDSYFSFAIENQRRNLPISLDGPYAFMMTQYIFSQAFAQAMIHEAWIYEAQRAGVSVSNSDVARALRTEGFTDTMLINMSIVERADLFKRQQLTQSVQRYQSGLLDNVQRPDDVMKFFLNPGQKERSALIGYLPFTLLEDDFLTSYIASHTSALQVWQLRRYVHMGDLASAQSIASRLAGGEVTISELALEQNEAALANYRDAYAELAGLMPAQLLYQIQQQVNLSSDELHDILVALDVGSASVPISFSGAPAGQEAYVFYQVEGVPTNPDIQESSVRAAVLAYLSSEDSATLLAYYNQIRSEIASENANNYSALLSARGAQVQASDYFSLAYGLNMSGGYSPYQGLITQFNSAMSGLDVAVIQGLLGSERFFAEVFNTPMQQLSPVILLANGVVIAIPTSERSYESSNAEGDTFYMNQFLRYQGQLEHEEIFRTSRRYNDDRFDRAFANVAQRMGLSADAVATS
jgi:hypothetical protein